MEPKRNDNRVYIDPLMKFYIESETRKLAEQLKREHKLSKITIPLISGSQWLADRLMNNKALIRYRVKKTGLNEGILEFL